MKKMKWKKKLMKMYNIMIGVGLVLTGFVSGVYVGKQIAPVNADLMSQVFYYGCLVGVRSNHGVEFGKCIEGSNIIYNAAQ